MHSFKEFKELSEISHESWEKYYNLYLVLNHHEKPDLKHNTLEDFCDYIDRSSKKLDKFSLILFFRDDLCVGFLQIWVEEIDTDDEELCVKTDFIDDGSIKVLIEDVKRYILDYYSTAQKLTLTTLTNGGEYLADKLNLRSKHVERNYILELKNINTDIIYNWITAIEASNPDKKVIFFKEIPLNLLEDYCKVLSFIENAMPDEPGNELEVVEPEDVSEDQAEMKEANEIVYSNVVINKENKIEAINRVYINQNKPKKICQWQLGCAENCSGKGYGKWLLSTMYSKIIEEFSGIDYVLVDTHPSNLTMIYLFGKIGFEYYYTLKTYGEQNEIL